MTTQMRYALLGGLLVLSIPLISFAAEFRTGDQPSFPEGESLVNDLYMAGGNVSASGSVQGDLVAAGGNMLLNGDVSADVLAAGGTISVSGEVGGDLRFGGGQVMVQGLILGDVVGGGGQVSLMGPGIGGDVAVGGGMVTLEAPVAGTVHLGGGEVRINAPITGNVFVKAEKLTLGPKAVLAGNLTYSAQDAATMEEGAVVRGTTTFEEGKGHSAAKAGAAAALATLFTLWMLAKVGMLLVGAFAIGYFFKRYSRELVATAAMQPWMEMLRGLIFVIVVPVVSVIFLATIIGIPLGVLGLLAYGATMIFISLAAPIVAGSIAHKLIWKPTAYEVNWKTILLGVAIYFVLGLIPFIGWIAKFALCILTLGAALNIKWGVVKEWR